MNSNQIDSILEYLPSTKERMSCRPYVSITTAEQAQLESIAVNPGLPFDGDLALVIRTLLRAGIVRVKYEQEIEEDSFLQSMKPVLGHEMMRWSFRACDDFAAASCDHLGSVMQTGDLRLAEDLVRDICETTEHVTHRSARIMIRAALLRRGFTKGVDGLRERMLSEDMNVYYLDNLIADTFQ